MSEILYKSMNIPKECEVGSTIFKKLFYENASMNSRDKEIFTDDINKIICKYSFQEDKINIKPYKDEEREYEELTFIEVLLNDDFKYKRIAEIIQRSIPYPIILVLVYKNRFVISVAHKRINKSDVSKNSVEEFIYTDWIDTDSIQLREKLFLKSINIKELSFNNYFQFYTDFVDKINIYNASKYHNDYEALLRKDADETKAIIDSVEELEKNILDMNTKIIKEKQISRRIKLNVELKKMEDKKERLLNKINTG